LSPSVAESQEIRQRRTDEPLLYDSIIIESVSLFNPLSAKACNPDPPQAEKELVICEKQKKNGLTARRFARAASGI